MTDVNSATLKYVDDIKRRPVFTALSCHCHRGKCSCPHTMCSFDKCPRICKFSNAGISSGFTELIRFLSKELHSA